MRRILIAGYGRMGSWLASGLSERARVAVYEPVAAMTAPVMGNGLIFLDRPGAAADFSPDIFINCAPLKSTADVFRQFNGLLHRDCLIADIASVKRGLHLYYRESGRRFVSVHPMFGPTFSDMGKAEGLNCIVISESDEEGKEFFKDFFSGSGIVTCELSFSDHDRLMSQVLSVPYIATLLFATASGAGLTGGTTWRRYVSVAEGLFSEDREMLARIMTDNHTVERIEEMEEALSVLKGFIIEGDLKGVENFISSAEARFLRKK